MLFLSRLGAMGLLLRKGLSMGTATQRFKLGMIVKFEARDAKGGFEENMFNGKRAEIVGLFTMTRDGEKCHLISFCDNHRRRHAKLGEITLV